MALFHRGYVPPAPGLVASLPKQPYGGCVFAGRLLLHDLTGAAVDRMVELMETYRDRPMDLADASVVAAAEHLGMRRVFALDRDFYIYRLADGSTLEVVP